MPGSVFPVLKSKISAPKLPAVFISRTTQEDQLIHELIAGRHILFLCSPVGYGKTTLLARITELLKINYGWVSLDKLDNDPERLAQYLGEALSLGGLPAAPDKDNDILAVLNRIELYKKPFLLVLDDLQEVINNDIYSLLKVFLNYLPENCSIAIASKENLPLPFSYYRQEGRLTELRINELKALENETAMLLSQYGIELSEDEIKIICKKTDGWWSCLKLFALTWKQLPDTERNKFLKQFGGSTQFVAEFILESFYSLLPENTAYFASAVSIPDFFTEDMCSVLLGKNDCSNEIMYLRKLNVLGVREDYHFSQYRFNPMIRDYLRYRLPKQERLKIHLKAAAWFFENGFNARGKYHSEASKDRVGRTVEHKTTENNASGLQEQGKFSRREKELLIFLEKGLSNEEIGNSLFISTGTVKWHLNNIYNKLDVKTRSEAVHKARQLKLIS